ncbi:LCP family protein [Enterococcus bulliens]
MKIFRRVLIGVVAVVFIVAGYIGIEFFMGYQAAKEVTGSQTNAPKVVKRKDIPDILQVALVGSDARSLDENGRSDSLMVGQYNQKTHDAKLVSIMRDSYVDIPGYGEDKINAAYSYGGYPLLQETLKDNFAMDVPYYVTITFQSFIDCVNEIFPNGVTIDAEKEMELDGVEIHPGVQKMDGNTLLQYARFREDEEGDFGRVRRQQQVVTALADQVKDVTSILKLPKAVGKLMGSIQTNLPQSFLVECGLDFVQEEVKEINTLSVPVEGSWDFNDNTPSGSVLELDLQKNQQAIKQFLNQ